MITGKGHGIAVSLQIKLKLQAFQNSLEIICVYLRLSALNLRLTY